MGPSSKTFKITLPSSRFPLLLWAIYLFQSSSFTDAWPITSSTLNRPLAINFCFWSKGQKTSALLFWYKELVWSWDRLMTPGGAKTERFFLFVLDQQTKTAMKWFRRSMTLYIGKRHWLCNCKEYCQTAKSIKKPHLKFQQVRTLDWQGLGPLIEWMAPLNSWSLQWDIWTSAFLHMTRLFHDFTAVVDLPQGMLSDNDQFISILVTQTAIKLLPPWKVFFEMHTRKIRRSIVYQCLSCNQLIPRDTKRPLDQEFQLRLPSKCSASPQAGDKFPPRRPRLVQCIVNTHRLKNLCIVASLKMFREMAVPLCLMLDNPYSPIDTCRLWFTQTSLLHLLPLTPTSLDTSCLLRKLAFTSTSL